MSVAAGARRQKGERMRAFWDNVKAVSRPMVVYWIFNIVMFGCFSLAALAVGGGAASETLIALAVFGVTTVSAVLFGQLVALLRIRDWVVMAFWAVFWMVGFSFSVALTMAAGALGAFVIFFVTLFPIFMTGGVWSLRVNRALFAAWVPLVYACGTVIIVAEAKGKVATWLAGNKWAVWDIPTLGVLVLAIVFTLLYLVMRETHRLHLWRRGPRAPLYGTVLESGAARPRLSCLSWVLLGMLALVLAVGTAGLGPYLWRTTSDPDAKDQSDNSDSNGDQKDQGKKKNQGNKKNQGKKSKSNGGQGDSMEQVQQAMDPATNELLNLLINLLIILTLLTLGFLLAYRPLKRLVVVRHLRRPYWRLPPTRRIENGWRLVEIAMGDVGVPPRPNEPAVSLCLRSGGQLRALSGADVHGLEQAAEVRDRITYGLGIGTQDLELMDRVSTWAYDTVWERLDDWGQLKAMYRGL